MYRLVEDTVKPLFCRECGYLTNCALLKDNNFWVSITCLECSTNHQFIAGKEVKEEASGR